MRYARWSAKYLAGQIAGARAASEGATKALCAIQEAYNTGLVDRCEGYGEAVPMELTDNFDPATIVTRATAATVNPDVDAVSVGPHVCEGVAKAMDDLGMSGILTRMFRFKPRSYGLNWAGKVSFTIDQQQRLCHMPIIVLHLYNSAGLLPVRIFHLDQDLLINQMLLLLQLWLVSIDN